MDALRMRACCLYMYDIVEVEKIVYRDREPSDEEAPIQFARENKKVQRSAAPKVQRSAAPQKRGMIEDTFPIIEFEEKNKSFIEDTFPIIKFDSADAVQAAPRRSPVLNSRRASCGRCCMPPGQIWLTWGIQLEHLILSHLARVSYYAVIDPGNRNFR